jgi:low affinity Fe/Cu permease
MGARSPSARPPVARDPRRHARGRRRDQGASEPALAEQLASVEHELETRAAGRSRGSKPGERSRFHEVFRRIAHATANAIGTPIAFMLALATIIVWAVLGPAFGYSDTWQLVINTSTTIVTFLVVFMIQNTQNRDSQAIHLKLDELIRAVGAARNAMVDVEDLPDEELARLQREMHQVCAEASGAPCEGHEKNDKAARS